MNFKSNVIDKHLRVHFVINSKISAIAPVSYQQGFGSGNYVFSGIFWWTSETLSLRLF